MRTWDPLNDKQLDVLQRVGAEQDLSGPDHVRLRHSANAVRDRGLITISKRGGIWRGEITEAGRFYLEHGYHPDDPRHTVDSAAFRSAERAGVAPNGTRHQLHKLAEEIIQLLQDNKGTFRVDDPDEQTRARYRQAIHAAKQHNLVPAGFQLRHTGRNSGDLIIQLADNANPDETEWNRIRLGVRDQVVETSALTRLLQDNPEVLDVSDTARPRALSFVETLAESARRRGHKVAMSKKRKHRGLYMLSSGYQFPFTIREEQDTIQRQPAGDPAARKTYSWQRRPLEYDQAPSGRLRLELPESQHGRRSSWADDGRSTIEAKIDQIFKEIDQRTTAHQNAELEHQRRMAEWAAEDEREEAARRAAWEAAMEQARTKAIEDHRVKSFRAAFDSWQEAMEIRAFCDALAESAEKRADDTNHLGEWIDWGRSVADHIDPLSNPAQLAEISPDAQPSPDDLRRFLGDWSPHRPEKEYRPQHSEPSARVSEPPRQAWHPGLRGRAQWWRH